MQGPDGLGLELVAWREHSLNRRKKHGERALIDALRVKQELEKPQLYVAKDAEGNMRVGVVDPSDVNQRATMDLLREVAEGRLVSKEEVKEAAVQASAARQAADEAQVAHEAAEREALRQPVSDPWGPEFERRPAGHAEPWAVQRRPG